MILPSGSSTVDYSRLANSRGWGSGWPACGGMAGNIVQIKLTRSGTSIAGGVHKNIAELFLLIGNEIERRGYMFHPGWCWGAECRAISGSNTPSNHSWGLAVDTNAPNNPYTSSGVHDIPDWAYALFRSYGFGCGADYSGKKDWMHVEFMGTPSDAAIMTGLARQNIGGGQPPPPIPPEDDSMSAAELNTLIAKIDAVAGQVTNLKNLLFQAGYDVGGHSIREEVGYAANVIVAPLVQQLLDRVEVIFFEDKGALWEADLLAGTTFAYPDETTYKTRQSVLTQAGRKWTTWPGGDVDTPGAFGRQETSTFVAGPDPKTPPPPPATYTVVAGDTLSGIAAKTGVSQANLQAWNKIADPNTINVGDVLRLTSP